MAIPGRSAIHVEGHLSRQPALRLLQFVRWKKLHRRATDSRSGKTKRKRLPTGLSDDGDLGNFTAMQKKENRDHFSNLRRAPNPQSFKNDERARFQSHVNPAGEGVLLCANSDRFKMPLMRNT